MQGHQWKQCYALIPVIPFLYWTKNKPEEVVFAEKKELIRNLWEEVKDDYVVKLAAGRVRIMKLNILNQII